MPRRLRSIGATIVLCSFLAGCGGAPTTPPPPPRPAPLNALPVIEGITVQGRRLRQPERMADLREIIDIRATVRDTETSLDELTYQWSATAGTFTGTGRMVTWTAPDSAATTPMIVTITLKVIEQYGHPGEPKTFSQDVSSTQTLALHDSVKEVGDMSRQFLIDFSTTTLKDSNVIMRNFNRAVCPRPREVDDERVQVENHYQNFVMNAYSIGTAQVSINFGEFCAVPGEFLPGDACSAVRVMWDSTGPTGRLVTTGVDLLTAVYSSTDSRWWLCSSRFDGDTNAGHAFYAK